MKLPSRFLAWMFVGLIAGCGGDGVSTQSDSKSAGVVISIQDLPSLGDAMPRLDKDRLEVAPPDGWAPASRSNKYVVRFLEDDHREYPILLVTADDYAEIADVDSSNVEKFAAAMAEEKSTNSAEPISVGPFVGVTYRRRAKEPGGIGQIVERLFVATVTGGRRYTIELRTQDGSLEESRDALYATAAGMKFFQEEVVEEVETLPEEEATETDEAVETEAQTETEAEADGE